MDRRKFIKAGSVVAVAAATSLALTSDSNSLSWDLVDTDALKHKPENHVYKLLSTLSVTFHDTYHECNQFVFTVGGDQIRPDKVYEKKISPGIVIWCNTADYKIIKDLDFTGFLSIGIVEGLIDPTRMPTKTPATFVDGYEVHLRFK